QSLQMAVCIDAELVLDRLRQVPPEKRIEVLERRFQEPDDEGDDRQHHQLIPDVHDTEAGEERILRLHDHVDRHSDQEWRAEIEYLIEDGTDGGEPDPLAMWRGILEETAQRLFGRLPGGGSRVARLHSGSV